MIEKIKNRKRVLILLLVLCVAVTATFIGSLAKYVTSDEGADEADVAKFGLNIPNAVELFSDSYTNVAADPEGKKIIAPGTDGEYKFEVTGTSEVAYAVSANIDLTYSEEWDGYEPLEFSLDGDEWTDFDTFEENLSTALGDKVMEPNEEYASAQTIHWRWPFHTSTENDIKDTAVGALASTGDAPKVTVDIEVVATQVD